MENELEQKIKEANKYKYDQSSKGSELIRKIVFAIIGSCWLLMFTNGKYQETNIFLKVTIACGFVYLLLDVVHYFWDTCSYHYHAQKMEQCPTTDYVERVYKPADLRISKRSFIFFVLKVCACFVVSFMFLLGMFTKPLSSDTKQQIAQPNEMNNLLTSEQAIMDDRPAASLDTVSTPQNK